MLSKENESALKNALKDLNFPSSSVVMLTPKRKAILRTSLELGITLGTLPELPDLGKRLKSTYGTNATWLLSLSKVLTSTRPGGRNWVIPEETWSKILHAAHEHSGQPSVISIGPKIEQDAVNEESVRVKKGSRTAKRSRRAAKTGPFIGKLVPFEAQQLRKAMKDPAFPGPDIVRLPPSLLEPFRVALYQGLKEGTLPNLGMLSVTFKENNLGILKLRRLSKAGVIKNPAPRMRTWMVDPKVWAAIFHKVMDNVCVEIERDDVQMSPAPTPAPKVPKNVVGVHPSLDWKAFSEILNSEVADIDAKLEKLQQEMAELTARKQEKAAALLEVLRHAK